MNTERLAGLVREITPSTVGSVGENVPELAQRITDYAASVHEANKRTLDPIIVELMPDRQRIILQDSGQPRPDQT